MSAQCYGIDGTPYPDTRYVPCNKTAAQNGKYTACCAPGDVCLTNGLCQEAGGNKAGVNLFWRNGCTDPTWNDAACAKHCGNEGSPQSHAVHYCLEPNAYCCPTGGLKDTGTPLNTTCCSIPNLEFTALDPIVYTTANRVVAISTLSAASSSSSSSSSFSSSSSTISTRISTTTPNSTPPSASSTVSQTSQTSQPASSAPAPTSSKTGIYVGVPLGIALLVAISIIAWFIHRRHRTAKKARMSTHGVPELFHEETKRPYYAEADVGRRPSELAGPTPVAELSGVRY